MPALRCGANRLGEYKHLFKDARVGLVTTPTGRTSDGRSTIAALQQAADLRVLLGPEHGVRGDGAAGAFIPQYTDAATGLPVFSLYGKDSKRLTPAMLETFDVLVYDIQDVGSRYYTFLSTLAYLIEDCAGAGKRLVVLDRPDPLGGEIIEGTTLRPGMESFVGCYPLPTRYALTIGEFAQMVNAEQHFGCDLTVVPCTGWQRGQSAPAWGTPWIMPSPNIPNYETALLYVGTCLFEGTNVSEGRGTAAPFAVIGAPYIHDAEALAAAFNARGLPGICATPYYFTPTFSKHQGQLCGGVHLHVLDADAVRPLSAGLTLLELIRDTCPNDFALLPPHTEGGRPFISLLAGHRELERPDWTAAELIKAQAPDEAAFAARKAAYHLY